MQHPDLQLPASGTVRNNARLSPPVYGIFVTAVRIKYYYTSGVTNQGRLPGRLCLSWTLKNKWDFEMQSWGWRLGHSGEMNR